MNANQEIGIDLPQKMLVYENEKGEIFVVYNNSAAITDAHGISNKDVVAKISGALKNLAESAATNND